MKFSNSPCLSFRMPTLCLTARHRLDLPIFKFYGMPVFYKQLVMANLTVNWLIEFCSQSVPMVPYLSLDLGCV